MFSSGTCVSTTIRQEMQETIPWSAEQWVSLLPQRPQPEYRVTRLETLMNATDSESHSDDDDDDDDAGINRGGCTIISSAAEDSGEEGPAAPPPPQVQFMGYVDGWFAQPCVASANERLLGCMMCGDGTLSENAMAYWCEESDHLICESCYETNVLVIDALGRSYLRVLTLC